MNLNIGVKMAPTDNITSDLLDMRRKAEAGKIARPTRPQRAAQAKVLAAELADAKAKVKEVGQKHRAVSRARMRSVDVDWEENGRRIEKLLEIIEASRLEKKEIAVYLGMTRTNLYYYLSGRTPLNDQIESDIKQAIRDLLEERRIQINKAFGESAQG